MSAPTSKDEYLKASNRLATGFGPTVDFADRQLGTTVQTQGGIGDAQEYIPGQVFSVDQLPDPAVAVAYGLPPVRVPEHLILDSVEEAEAHIQGKTEQDIANARVNGGLREALGEPLLGFDNVVRPADDTLTSFSERTGEGAFTAQGTDDTGSGKPVDPEGVQRADGGGAAKVTTSNSGSGQGEGDKGRVGGKAK